MSEIWQSKDWPNFSYDRGEVQPLLAELSKDIGLVQGLHAGLSPRDREQIILREITQEAVHSFGIEGVILNAAEIEASVVASLAGRNFAGISQRSDAVAVMFLVARDPNTILNKEVLGTWHKLLFEDSLVEDIGRWRQSELVIVKSARADREEILYKALPAPLIEDAMQIWVQSVSDSQTHSTPVFAALMHLWFESIHPFSDGNGRIGRAIVENIFAKSGALPFSLSRQIEADKKGYYAALQAGRKQGRGCIDATAFVVWFLKMMQKASERGLEEAKFLIARNQFFMRFSSQISTRQEKVFRKIFEKGQSRVVQGLSNKSYIKIAKTSEATATRDLTDLLGKGIVKKTKARGRSTCYVLTGFDS